MSKVGPTALRRVRREAMQRLWPDHVDYCTLRPLAYPDASWRMKCGVVLVPLTVDTDYLSVRCPSCRVITIHQRIVPLNR